MTARTQRGTIRGGAYRIASSAVTGGPHSVATTPRQATLYGPNHQHEVVEVGSQRASQLQSQGWGLQRNSYTAPGTTTTTPVTDSSGGSDYPTYTPPTPYAEPTTQDAMTNNEYTTGASLIDQQAGINTATYAQRRQDLINSYQSALDSINLGLREAGVRSREQYAGNNLYDASGEVSGIGQGVGAQNTAPYLNQIGSLQTRHESNLTSLANNESQSTLDTATSKNDLLNTVLNNIRTSAQNRFTAAEGTARTTYNSQVDAYDAAVNARDADAKASLDAAKLPGGRIDTLKIRKEQQAKGRFYLGSPSDVAKAKKQYGNDSIIKIGKDYFILSASERQAMTNAKLTAAKKVKDLNKVPTPRTPKTSVREIKNSLISDINGAADVVTATGEPGKRTREDVANEIFQAYKEDGYTLEQIKQMIYDAYPG